jgi:hypothetical protein
VSNGLAYYAKTFKMPKEVFIASSSDSLFCPSSFKILSHLKKKVFSEKKIQGRVFA